MKISRFHRLCILVTLMIGIASAEERSTLKEAPTLDPNASDILSEFRQVGLPKYTDVEKRIIDRVGKIYDEHTALYERIEKGKSVLEYPGLIALGVIRYDPKEQIPYSLTFGVRPHNAEFAKVFCEYRITFDAKGIVESKAKVAYERK